ncbi:MFS transporter [Actinokineospora pegani]|uniref:MFS transporter n=1 Tax=Actinokineospora pegani TaxID=2654637 RepID=UPI0012EAE5E4|nr:MFS transporter [Actinokineospora pegani]
MGERAVRITDQQVTDHDGTDGERAVVVVVAVAAGIAAMSQTLVVPLLGDLPALLGAGPAATSWVVTAALLSGAVTSPVIGRLGDLHGKRLVLLVVLGLVTLGSLLCAVSWSLAPMVAGRALQGLGMGVVPLGISLLREVISPRRVGSAIAVTSSALGVGAAFGLPFAAAIAEVADWHLLFAGVGVLTAVIAVLVARLVTAAPGPAEGRFDLVGAVTLSAGLTALLLVVSRGGEWGWTAPGTVGLLVGAALALAAWAGWERRVATPLIDLATATRTPVLLTNTASVVVGFAMYAQILMVPQLLQLPEATGHGLGFAMLAAGLLMAPAGAAMMAASAAAARIAAARGPKAALLLGTVLMGLGYLVCLAALDSVAALVAGTVVTNAGVGFAYGSLPALIMRAVAPSETGAANGFNTLMRSIGSAAAGAVVGAVFAAQGSTAAGGAHVPLRGAFVLVGVIGVVGSVAALAVSALIPTVQAER